MKNKCYVITSRFTKLDYWTAVAVDSRVFYSRDEAIMYCQDKLNKEELERNLKMQKRNLINWYEFQSKNYVYEIKECKID